MLLCSSFSTLLVLQNLHFESFKLFPCIYDLTITKIVDFLLLTAIFVLEKVRKLKKYNYATLHIVFNIVDITKTSF